jgi:hypothetical protein
MRRADFIAALDELDTALAEGVERVATQTSLPWWMLLESVHRGATARLMKQKPTDRLGNYETRPAWGPPGGRRENAPPDPKNVGTTVSSADAVNYTIERPQGKVQENVRANQVRRITGYGGPDHAEEKESGTHEENQSNDADAAE